MTDVLARLRAALQGQYRVDREVGSGGMATVYLAHDVKHGRGVAIKVLLPDLAAAVGSDRFLREIKVTSTLQHPHILPLYDSGAVDGLVYYVMPFVEGESLRARLERVKQLPVREALDIARAVASALDYAHRRNVVHRDIKPENILLGMDGQHAVSGLQAVVADFGVAAAVASADQARLTASGVAVGTPAYMSPEQATAEPGLGPSSDVYALGAVLYEMLVGEPPFTGPTVQAILARSASESPVAPRLRRPTVPTAVDRAIMTALAKVPTDRFASAGSFAEALQTEEQVSASRAPRLVRTVAIPWVLSGVLALALVMQLARRPESVPWQALVKSTLLAPPGEEFSDRHNFGALSRDGRRFAFVVQPERGAARLWVQNMDELVAQPLAGTEGASAPFWSPDGRSLAFFANGKLRRIAAGGGVPVDIAEAEPFATGTWGPANLIYFSSPAGIVRVPAEGRGGKPPELVFRSDSGSILSRPSIGDDADYILLTGVPGDLFRGDTRTGTLTKLQSDAVGGQLGGDNTVLYVRGGSNLMLQSIDLGRGVMVGEPYDLGGPVRSASNMMSFTTSMSGTAAFLLARAMPGPLVVNRGGSVVDTIKLGSIAGVGHGPSTLALGSDAGLHRYDVQRKMPNRIHRTPGLAVLAFSWSPDDSRIAFSDWCALAVIAPSGVGFHYVPGVRDGECLRVTDWWSDDRVLVNKDVAGRPSEIWEYRISDGKGSPVVTADVAAIDGTVSPDGQLLAYALEENGTFEVFVRPLRDDGSGDRISLESGRAPRWRGDGRELYFVTAAGDVMAADVPSGPRPTIGAPKLLFRAIGWERNFFRDSRFRPFDVEKDGQRFYLSQSRIEGPAVLLQNLHSELRRDSPPRQ
jgi:serine/threonine-protein kinase